MKVKTSVTLSQDVLDAINDFTGQHKNRSDLVEAALWAYIAQRARADRDARDLAIINEQADRLNAEALDALTYQIPL